MSGTKRRAPRLSPEALEVLRTYCWPGNVRELRNMIDRALVLCEGSEIRVEHLDMEKIRTTRMTPATARPRVTPACLRCRGTDTQPRSTRPDADRAHRARPHHRHPRPVLLQPETSRRPPADVARDAVFADAAVRDSGAPGRAG